MRPNVTVCIPAYRSEAFIHNTLRSVLTQTYSDLVIEIGIEPPAEQILAACGSLLQDQRVKIIVNPQVLGWAENMRALLRRVVTPYFVMLSHDDILVNDYVATLIAELIQQPQASVAFGDMVCFGAEAFHWELNLSEKSLFDRLMSFFVAGTEAVPLRGVTRATVRNDFDFPTDQEGGFATECEWVFQLLIAGTAVRVPRPLYLKRVFGPNEISASNRRLLGRSREQLLTALENHRGRMLSLLQRTELSEAQTDILRLGLEAAMLRRHMSFGIGPFVPLQIARYEEIMTLSDSVPGDYGKMLRAMSLLAMSHHAFAEGDSKAALDFALAAVAADTRHLEALVTVGRLQLNAGRTVEAFDAALRAWTVAPDGRGLRRLLADCEFGIEHSHFLEMVQSGRAQLVAARFDSGAYLTDHPDIAKAGLDPWHHYCEYGWREGRKFRLLHLNG